MCSGENTDIYDWIRVEKSMTYNRWEIMLEIIYNGIHIIYTICNLKLNIQKIKEETSSD